MDGCLRNTLIALGAVVFSLLCLGYFLYQAVFPHVPRFASPVSTAADSGAVRIAVPYCLPDPAECEGYLRFFREGRLLLYHDREGLSGFDPATGAQLWQTHGQFNDIADTPHLVETANGAYAFAEFSGQVVDLDDGRVALQGWMFRTASFAATRDLPTRVSGGLYRLPFADGVFLADLESGRIAPYAAPERGVENSGVLPPKRYDWLEPGWRGPIDQTDDGNLAVWFLLGPEHFVALYSRDRGAEVWRTKVPEAPLQAWIDNELVVVELRGSNDRIAFEGALAARPPPRPARAHLSTSSLRGDAHPT